VREDAALFQYLYAEATRIAPRPSKKKVRAALEPVAETNIVLGLLAERIAPRIGKKAAKAAALDPSAGINIVLGPTKEKNRRAALVMFGSSAARVEARRFSGKVGAPAHTLAMWSNTRSAHTSMCAHVTKHDDETNVTEVIATVAETAVPCDGHVFVLLGPPQSEETAPLSFPSEPIGLNQPTVEAAADAMDSFAGDTLRKGGDTTSGYKPAPLLSAAVNRAVAGARSVGIQGNTSYFACAFKLDTLQLGRLSMWEARAGWHASRTEAAGFNQTKTLSNRAGGVAICSIDTALRRLEPYDRRALETVVRNAQPLAVHLLGQALKQLTGQVIPATAVHLFTCLVSAHLTEPPQQGS
jgi:hypothetical protein